MSGPSPALELVGVRKHYAGPIRAVDGVDLTVPRGQMFGLLGPNGAGKSTTVEMCTTRIRPTAGTIRIHGVDAVTDAPAVKRMIGVVTQTNTLDRSLTLWENLYYHVRYFGWSRADGMTRADELLQRFRLHERAQAFPSQISGGMAQRLQVARAIAHRPQVLFLDEPTAGLDPQSRIALWEAVQGLRADGLTVVLTTHYMEEADALCEQVAIIDHGRILVRDSPHGLKRQHGGGVVVDLALEQPATDGQLARIGAIDAVTDVEVTGHRVRILAAHGGGLVAQVVDAAGGGLRDVSLKGATLESVFINLTGRDLRE